MNKLNNLYEQITPKTTPEELSEKIINAKEIKRAPKRTRFRPAVALAAAGIAVSSLVLTAGAVNGWDYAGMFKSIFGEKTENIMENIVPAATVLQDTIDTMDFEITAVAADKHSVLAIIDVYSENGFKLVEEIDGSTVIHPLQDLHIYINAEIIGGSGTGINILEASEDKVRLSVRMSTETEIKNERLTIGAYKTYAKGENEVFAEDYSWQAEFTAAYTGEEIRYEKDMTISGEDHYGDTVSMTVTGIEVSPISAYLTGSTLDNFFGAFWNAKEVYVLLDSGEKVRITDITASSYTEGDPNQSELIVFGFEEPVSPAEVCALEFSGKVIELK